MFGVALAVRIVHQIIMSGNDPMYGFLLPGGDNHTYDRWAAEIAQTFWLGWDRIPFLHGPLYPYFLGLIYLRFGHSHDAAIWVQRLLGAVTVVLIFYLARRIFGKRAGWFAGVGAAGCPLFLLYEGEILVETLILFVNVVTLCVFVRAGAAKSLLWWAFSGLGLGVCCLGRPNNLLFIPVVACWIVWIGRGGVRGKVAAVIVFVICTCATIAPATWLNYFVGGKFHPVTYSTFINLYIGNAPDAIGIFCTPPSMQEIRAAEQKDDMDIIWRRHLWHALLDNPGSLPRNLWLKTRLFWQSGELPSNINYYLKRPFSPFLALPLRWATIAPLGLIGLAVAMLRKPPRRLDDSRVVLLGYLIVYATSIIVVFVLGRLRLPALAVLFICAGYAMAVITEAIHSAWKYKRPRGLWVAAAILVGWVALGWGLKSRDDTLLIRWNDYYNLGSAYEARGMDREALEQYEKARARAPHIEALNSICEDMRARTRDK